MTTITTMIAKNPAGDPSPRVSIITPCYNSARYVEQTVASVRAQTLGHWEHIVVDDGSKDDPASALAAHLTDEPRLRLVRQENGGVASARNRGFREAVSRSDYIYFLDADDCLEPDALEHMVAYLDNQPDVGMVHSAHLTIDGEGNVSPHRELHIADLPRYVPAGSLGVRELRPVEPETPFAAILTVAGIVPSICLLRRSVYEQTPGWDEAFGQHHEDTDVFLQMALRSKVHYLDEPLVRYRRHASQNTADMARFGQQEEKLCRKWAMMSGLSPVQQLIIQDALRFKSGPLAAHVGFRAAHKRLRQGDFKGAIKFGGGAIKRCLYALIAPARLDEWGHPGDATTGRPVAG